MSNKTIGLQACRHNRSYDTLSGIDDSPLSIDPDEVSLQGGANQLYIHDLSLP
jgi:hypothetical protein